MDSQTRTRWSHAGALTTAGTVAATIFCCLPFASGLIGAGIAAFGARFAPLRPYLATLSVGCLAYAFYQTYRSDGDSCADDTCDTPSNTRARRLALWIVATLVVLLLTASWWANWVIYWTL